MMNRKLPASAVAVLLALQLVGAHLQSPAFAGAEPIYLPSVSRLSGLGAQVLVVGQIGGTAVNAVLSQGDRAYVGIGSSLAPSM